MSSPSQMEILSAEYGIRQLHSRCIDAVWRLDSDAFVECFTTNGEWKIVGNHWRGCKQLRDGFESLMSKNERVLMQMSNPVLTIGNGIAQGTTYVTELIKRRDQQGVSTIGTYQEEFVFQDGIWLFQKRTFALHYYGPTDLSADFMTK